MSSKAKASQPTAAKDSKSQSKNSARTSKSGRTNDSDAGAGSIFPWIVSKYLKDLDHPPHSNSSPESAAFPHPAWKTETAGVEKQKNIFEAQREKHGLRYAVENHRISPTFKQFEDLGDLVMRDFAEVGWNLLTGQGVVGTIGDGGVIPLGKFLEECELVGEGKKFGGEVAVWGEGGANSRNSGAGNSKSSGSDSDRGGNSSNLVLAFRFRHPAMNQMLQRNFGLSEAKGCETPRGSEGSVGSVSGSSTGGMQTERFGWMLMNGTSLCALKCFWEGCGKKMVTGMTEDMGSDGEKRSVQAWTEGKHQTGNNEEDHDKYNVDKNSGDNDIVDAVERESSDGFFAEGRHEGKGGKKGKPGKKGKTNMKGKGNKSQESSKDSKDESKDSDGNNSVSMPSADSITDSVSSLTPVPSKRKKEDSKSLSVSEFAADPHADASGLSQNFSSLSLTPTSSKSNLIPIPTPERKSLKKRVKKNVNALPPDALAIELQVFPRDLYEDFRSSLKDVGKVRVYTKISGSR